MPVKNTSYRVMDRLTISAHISADTAGRNIFMKSFKRRLVGEMFEENVSIRTLLPPTLLQKICEILSILV